MYYLILHQSYAYISSYSKAMLSCDLSFSMGRVRKHHACTAHHQSTTIAVTLSRYHSSSSLFHLFLLSFPSLLYVMGAEIRNAGPTLPVDVSMINRPLTRTRNYYIYNCAGNWAHIYLVLDKRTGSRNKVTIVELGSVNLSQVFYEEWTTGQPGPPNWSKRSCGAN
jgi:hypothetical protein